MPETKGTRPSIVTRKPSCRFGTLRLSTVRKNASTDANGSPV